MASVLIFPTPLPDETIASLVARYHQISGGLSVRRTLMDLFGAVTKSHVSDLPCYLGHLERVSGFEGLADGHTLLPYYEPFLSAEKARYAREMMYSSHPIGLKLSLGITAAGFEKFHVRRYCPRCVAVDFHEFGVAYWHLSHQASGVHVCAKHHCYLHQVLPEPGVGGFNQLFLPNQTVEHGHLDAVQPFPREYFGRLAQLADLIEWGRSSPYCVAQLLGNDYLHFVTNRAGYIFRGRVCSKKLEEHFRYRSSFYPEIYEFRRIFELHQDRVFWPSSLLRKRLSSHHPILFYMFISCFDVDLAKIIEDFSEEVRYVGYDKSVSVVKSMLPNDIELVKRRSSFITAYASLPAKQIADYSWLYRNDRDWLQSYISENRKPVRTHDLIDWEKRDRELAEMIEPAVAEIKSLSGPIVQVSLASICRSLNLHSDTFRQRSKVPRSIKVINDNLETIHDFQFRKVTWALEVLVAEKEVVNRSSLLRRANIRVCKLSEREISIFLRY